MTGGGFELTGGFWAVVPEERTCLGDLTGESLINGSDIQMFVDCILGTNGSCDCADVDAIGGLDMNDVTVFVNDLLAGAACP